MKDFKEGLRDKISFRLEVVKKGSYPHLQIIEPKTRDIIMTMIGKDSSASTIINTIVDYVSNYEDLVSALEEAYSILKFNYNWDKPATVEGSQKRIETALNKAKVV